MLHVIIFLSLVVVSYCHYYFYVVISELLLLVLLLLLSNHKKYLLIILGIMNIQCYILTTLIAICANLENSKVAHIKL